MSLEFEHALLALRSDCERSVGSPFLNFYCPILFRDEEVPLCKAHIVNTAFPSSHRCWVVQRKDLDNFYGSHFENDFVDIQYRGKNFTESILADPYLSKNLSPKIRFGDKGIEHFVASGPVPANFTEAAVGGPSGPVRLGLKIHPDDAVTEIKNDWSIVIEKDIRLPALVSILEAAHLTIFKMLGYSYALSAGGHLLGWEILGKFFLGNHALARPQVLANARAHFTEFANMVRPPLTHQPTFKAPLVTNSFSYAAPAAKRLGESSCSFAPRTPRLQARVLAAIKDGPKDGSTHWSCRKLAAHLQVSKDTVQRILSQADVRPHRLARYMASDDPDFETKAADVIGLYIAPPLHRGGAIRRVPGR